MTAHGLYLQAVCDAFANDYFGRCAIECGDADRLERRDISQSPRWRSGATAIPFSRTSTSSVESRALLAAFETPERQERRATKNTKTRRKTRRIFPDDGTLLALVGFTGSIRRPPMPDSIPNPSPLHPASAKDTAHASSPGDAGADAG